MQTTPLVDRLTSQIVEHISSANLPKGARLTERQLADQFRVSRSPVRSALLALSKSGILEAGVRGGFVVRRVGKGAGHSSSLRKMTSDEAFYFKIAEDRLSGLLPEKVTENELVRRYQMTRSGLATILRRISAEGWIERLPGHGWIFLPTLTSMEAYADSYRFRIVIEPAAILQPNFRLNRPALMICRTQQQELVDGEIKRVSNAELFDLNSKVHEAIIECSGNAFFIESLKRIDRLRRLIEYRQSLDRPRAVVRCREHVQILDLLLANKRKDAASMMRKHLSSVSLMKIAE